MNVEPLIDIKLVQRLIAEQFPKWCHLPIRPVAQSGWDNRSFHLGDDFIIRLPSAAIYATQVEKEQEWLPRLAPFLPLAIPVPVAMGHPTEDYPWSWSIFRWLPGETAASAKIDDLNTIAIALAHFLLALEQIDPTHGPLAGTDNFHRGGSLTVYDHQMRQALSLLTGQIDTVTAQKIWDTALGSHWPHHAVWVHGDISAGNLLIHENQLTAVIDFGLLTTGDPACDLVIAWTFFRGESREHFRTLLPHDPGTWARARAWGLWKASIIASGLAQSNAVESANAKQTIDEILSDYLATPI